MNLPSAVVDLPTLTDKDKDDIVNFGIPQGIDFIAASFVRKVCGLSVNCFLLYNTAFLRDSYITDTCMISIFVFLSLATFLYTHSCVLTPTVCSASRY